MHWYRTKIATSVISGSQIPLLAKEREIGHPYSLRPVNLRELGLLRSLSCASRFSGPPRAAHFRSGIVPALTAARCAQGPSRASPAARRNLPSAPTNVPGSCWELLPTCVRTSRRLANFIPAKAHANRLLREQF